MGSKKLGKGGGGGGGGSMNTNGSLVQKRRGRPPKDKNQTEAAYEDLPQSHIKPIENENSGEIFILCLQVIYFP